MFCEIVQVVPHDNYTVWVYFADGKVTEYDVKQNLNNGVFRRLKDISLFISKCRIMNDTLAWDVGENGEEDCIDIAPETLYACRDITDLIA